MYQKMEFKISTIIFLSFIILTSQDANIAGNNQQSSPTSTADYNEDDNSIVIEASTSSTKIVNNIDNKLNLLTDGQNNVGRGDTRPDLFSETGSCVCVPFYLCRKNRTIITDGADIIDIRVKPPTCNSYLEVCCKAPLDPSEVSTESPNRYPGNNDNAGGSSGCGRRNFEGAGVRISGNVNNEAQFGEFPWMIALLRNDKVDENITMKIYQCGGSLIHPQVVVTAAHCVANRDITTLQVRAGEWDTQTKNERLPHVDLHIKQVIIHEGYYSGGLFNDIALLITEQPFNLSDHIDTVCLPTQGTLQNNVVCTASGWGKDVFGKEGKYQVILKKVDLPMVPRERCQKQLRTTRLSQYFNLHESFICAGGEAGRDTCKGDGGGPLVCPVSIQKQPGNYETRYQQTGIVAWGVSCGEDNIPGVYVHVALFKNWIDNWMRQLRFDIRYYTL